MQPIVLYAQRGKLVAIMLLCAVFVLVGLWQLVAGGQVMIALSTIVPFGAGIAILAPRVFGHKPRIVINEEGILDRNLGVGIIPWEAIGSVHYQANTNDGVICLDMIDAPAWEARLPPLQRAQVGAAKALGMGLLNIGFVGVAADSHAVYEKVRAKVESARPA